MDIYVVTAKEVDGTSYISVVRADDIASAEAKVREKKPDVTIQGTAPFTDESIHIGVRIRDTLGHMWAMQEELNNKTFEKNDICNSCSEPLTIEMINKLGRAWQEKWVKNYTLAMQQELSELMDSTNWKWWRKNVDLFDEQNVKVELIDIFHFWMSACMVLGMSPQDVVDAYMKKNQVNHDRQDSGYITKDEDDCKHI